MASSLATSDPPLLEFMYNIVSIKAKAQARMGIIEAFFARGADRSGCTHDLLIIQLFIIADLRFLPALATICIMRPRVAHLRSITVVVEMNPLI